MALSTIGRCATIQLLLSLGTSSPPAAADHSFLGSIRHHTIDGCAHFTTRSSCPTGTGACTWHPQDGCASGTATAQMTEARTKESRNLQTTARPTRKPKYKPPTRKPTTTRKPTNKPTTRSPVSCFRVSLQFFICLAHIDLTCSTTDIRHPSRHRQCQRR